MNEPSFHNLKDRVSNIGVKKLGLFLLTAATAVDGGLLYNYAGAEKFTLKSTMGAVAEKTTPSGLYMHLPLVQYVHDYHKGTQTIDVTSGGMRFFPSGESTKDKNYLGAEGRLLYRVTEDAEKLGYHPWAMDGYVLPDGYWLLTDMMNQSANAVLGNRSLAGTQSNPELYAEEFYEDLDFRLKQNNVPVEVESYELKRFKTFGPTQTVSYQKVMNPKTGQLRR